VIDETYEKLEERAGDVDADDDARLESAAYQLHNLYNAVEDLLRLVATVFENQIADTGRWHIKLLRRMSHQVEGVRPALLSSETYRLLDGLRSFRRFFRHAYTTSIDYDLLIVNLRKARQVKPLLERDVEKFLEQLGAP